MPAKINPNDWDRLFAPNAPRRGGPLSALVTVLVIAGVLAGIAYTAQYVFERREQQVANAVATATAFSRTNIPLQTATAEAQAQATAEQSVAQAGTATVLAARPTAPPALGIGAVNSGGNLRSEPRVADDTVVGLIWPGDQITFLERLDVDGQAWYRIQVTREAPNRGGAGVAAGTEGWASASLLSPVAPAP